MVPQLTGGAMVGVAVGAGVFVGALVGTRVAVAVAVGLAAMLFVLPQASKMMRAPVPRMIVQTRRCAVRMISPFMMMATIISTDHPMFFGKTADKIVVFVILTPIGAGESAARGMLR